MLMNRFVVISLIAQSAGAEEYAECISVVGYDLLLLTRVLHMTLNNLVVRFQSLSSGECGVPLLLWSSDKTGGRTIQTTGDR